MKSATADFNVTEYLASRPLVEALWWFIENSEDEPWRTDAFFALRERVRTEKSQSDELIAFVDNVAASWYEGIHDDADMDEGATDVDIEAGDAVDWVCSMVCGARRLMKRLGLEAKS